MSQLVALGQTVSAQKYSGRWGDKLPCVGLRWSHFMCFGGTG